MKHIDHNNYPRKSNLLWFSAGNCYTESPPEPTTWGLATFLQLQKPSETVGDAAGNLSEGECQQIWTGKWKASSASACTIPQFPVCQSRLKTAYASGGEKSSTNSKSYFNCRWVVYSQNINLGKISCQQTLCLSLQQERGGTNTRVWCCSCK